MFTTFLLLVLGWLFGIFSASCLALVLVGLGQARANSK